MVTAPSLLLATILSATSSVELVEFTAPWCGPCRNMQPIVRQLQADGIPLRQLLVDDHRDLARQWGVDSIPCFLAVADGQVVGRIVGETSDRQLRELFHAARRRSREPAPTPSPAAAEPAIAHADVSPPAAAPAVDRSADPTVARCLSATVRLRVEDPQGISLGTGTVIDVHGREALVLTCGHIFRDGGGRGQIHCEFVGGPQPQQVVGHLISYDLRRDVGLISVPATGEVTAVRLASAGYQAREGEPVFSIGCDRGRNPSVIRNQVLAVNRYHGPANLVVGGRPVDGRSGGGLFTQDGRLIGVCNAADSERDEGLYAALGPVQAELDRAGLSYIYRQELPSLTAIAQQMASGPAPREHDDSSDRLQSPETHAAAGLASTTTGSADELICILRSRQSAGTDRVLVVEAPSPELLQRLQHELTQQPAAPALQAYRPSADHGSRAVSEQIGWRSQTAAAR